MFFKNIKTWSKKKLIGWNIVFSLIFLLFLVVIPTIIVGEKYNLFTTKEAGKKLSAIGLILIVIIGLYGFTWLKKFTNKMAQDTHQQRVIKFTLQMLFNLIPIALVLVALRLAETNTAVFLDCCFWCTISILGANIIDGLFLRYIEAEKNIRSEAQHANEVDSRKGVC